MPGGDRTGPYGLGAMTGRAAGYCAGFSVPGFANPLGGRGGLGRGFGRFGGGRGRGFRHRFFAPGYPLAGAYDMYWPHPAVIPTQGAFREADILRNQAKAMQSDLEALNARIEELEKIEAEKNNPEQ